MAIPKYWAGAIDDTEWVRGGTGDTPDEAFQDYIANEADNEADLLCCTWLDVKIYTTIEPSKSHWLVPDPDWEFVLDRFVERRGIWYCKDKDEWIEDEMELSGSE